MKHLNTVHWGIIGVGDVTEVKSGPAFYKSGYSELIAVMRRNAEKAADYAKRHNVPKWYSDGSKLINDPAVDAVYIATPPDSHASYAIEAMRAGKPAYVEKPMAKSYAECQEMLKVSEETGMPLYVAYYRRTLPAFLKAKELDVWVSMEVPEPITVYPIYPLDWVYVLSTILDHVIDQAQDSEQKVEEKLREALEQLKIIKENMKDESIKYCAIVFKKYKVIRLE